MWLGGGGAGVGAYVPCMNVKNGHFTFEELGHVPVGIQFTFMSFIFAISSSLTSYFKVMSPAGILPQQSFFKQ